MPPLGDIKIVSKNIKKFISIFIRFIISAGILIYLFSDPETNFNELLNRDIYWPYFFIGAGVYIGIMFLGVLRWRLYLLDSEIGFSFKKILQLFYIGLFFNTFLPSMAGGDVVKLYYGCKETHKRIEFVSATFMDRLTGLASFVVVMMAGGLLNIHKPKLFLPSIVALGISLVFIIFFISVLYFEKRREGDISVNENIIAHENKGLAYYKNLFLDKAKKIYVCLMYYRHRRLLIFKALLLTFIIHFLFISFNYYIALSLNYKNIRFLDFFLLIPIISMISSLPIAPNGWGIGEASYKKCFAYTGMSSADGVVLSIIIRLIITFVGVLGFPFYVMYKNAEDRSQKTEDRSQESEEGRDNDR
jgi:uncharacterized protein (TIRG00374 family)